MIGHIYIYREGDREIVAKSLEFNMNKSNTEIIEAYNDACTLGFVGVHRQALSVIALNIAFNKRFGKSPIRVTDNTLIEFTGAILLINNDWIYESILKN